MRLVLAEQEKMVVVDGRTVDRKALGTHLQLMGTLLTADVEDAQGQVEHGLQGECGLADARLAAQQDDASRHQTTTKYAVQFGVAHVDAWVVSGADVAESQDACGLGKLSVER